MQLSSTQRRKLRSAGKIIAASVIIACFYPVFADGFAELTPFINGLTIGLLGGVLVSFMELEVFDPLKRRGSFLKTLALKTVLYFVFLAVLIPVVMCFNQSVANGRGFVEHFNSSEFQHFLWEEDYGIILFYAFLFIGLIIFVRQINRKLGQGVLFNYVTGYYHQPREVERIIMYLDLRSSTKIAEDLGEIKFHNFLHEFFLDITEAILVTKGVIYDYVGDQVVVTWTVDRGLEKARCLMAYFNVKNRMKRIREKYLRQYGFVPRFSTSFHLGRVIVGELGDVKSQIVYEGEVLFETAAIEKLYSNHELEEQILISEPLLHRLSIPALYRVVEVGEIVRTNQERMRVYTLREQPAFAE